MTSSPEPVTPDHESRRPSARLRFAVAFLVGLILALGLGTGALYAYDQQYSGRILPGVEDVDLSGLTPDAARAALEGAYQGYGDGRIVLTGPDGAAVITYGFHDTEPPAPTPCVVGRSRSSLFRANHRGSDGVRPPRRG